MSNADSKPRVMFLCTGNSCRSQMAEGWARALHTTVIDAFSAGTHPTRIDPRAVAAMREVGIDISHQFSKRPDDINSTFDLVITVCGAADETCPFFPGANVMHHGFDDPPRLAKSASSDDEAMTHYRRVRDEIGAFVKTLPELLIPAHNKEKSMNASKRSCCGPSCCTSDEGQAQSKVQHQMQLKDNNASAATLCCEPGCCDRTSDSASNDARTEAGSDALRAQVREGYAKIAQTGSWSALQGESCCAGGGCCGPATFSPDQLAQAIGYSQRDLATMPQGANMGLSCGNPTAIASLKPGEVVLDLGAGGGFDCFIAGPKVGAKGRVIGVDMTPDMLTKARKNIVMYTKQTGLNNVEFRLGEIENVPVADASVDVVISNCVLNLSPDKPRVWQEIARVLKPGGRVAVSDLALLRPLPAAVLKDVEALVGCVAGAVLVEDTRKQAIAAGLVDIQLTSKPEYIDAMTNWEDPLYRKIIEALPKGSKPSDFITSLDVIARKA